MVKAEVSSLKEFSHELASSLQSLSKSHYNNPLLKEILNAFPRDGTETEIERGIENLLEFNNSQQSDQDVGRGQKRLVSDSEDENHVQDHQDPSQSKSTSTKKSSKRYKKEDEEKSYALEPDHPDFTSMSAEALTKYCKGDYLTSSWRMDKSREHTQFKLMDAMRKKGLSADEYEKLIYPERYGFFMTDDPEKFEKVIYRGEDKGIKV